MSNLLTLASLVGITPVSTEGYGIGYLQSLVMPSINSSIVIPNSLLQINGSSVGDIRLFKGGQYRRVSLQLNGTNVWPS